MLQRAQGWPPIGNNLHALLAAIFLLLPQALLRGRDLGDYGLKPHPRGLGLKLAAIGIFGILPLYAAGFVVWNRWMCQLAPSLAPGACALMLKPSLRWPPHFGMLVLAQLVVVALPEEFFFRGYLQTRLEEVWPPRRRLLGAGVGVAWIAAAALFALGHFLVSWEPQMLTRFFPGLVFGWMYARTRSILGGTLFHAACNLLMSVLGASFA